MIPTASSKDSTFTERKDSIVFHDTTIITRSKDASIASAIDSLLKIIDELKQSNTDTSIYVPVANKADSTLKSSISVNSNGRIKFTCKEDSLINVLHNLEKSFFELYVSKNKTETIIVPGVPVIKTKLPKWFWWLLGFNVVYFGLKITGVFYKPATGIFKLVLNAVKFI